MTVEELHAALRDQLLSPEAAAALTDAQLTARNAAGTTPLPS